MATVFDMIKRAVSTAVSGAKAKKEAQSSSTSTGTGGGYGTGTGSGSSAVQDPDRYRTHYAPGASRPAVRNTSANGGYGGDAAAAKAAAQSDRYYDPSTDYSLAISEARARGEDTARLEAERQNKINALYGGREPTMTGSDKTYSQVSGTSGSGLSRNEAIRRQMEAAARAGDWDKAGSLSNELLRGTDLAGPEGGTIYDGAYATKTLNEMQRQYGYNARDYTDRRYDEAFGAGSSAVWDATNGAVKSRDEWDRLTNGAALPGGSYGGGTLPGTGGSAYPAGGNYGGGYGSFQDFLDDSGYGSYTDATQAAIRAAVERAVGGYRSQMDTTNLESEELARQAYIAKMQGQKNLDQQLSASGLAGGMADSQRIALETDYQNQLKDIELQRTATIRELENAITNARLTGDMQTAQELADYLQNIQSQWASYVQFRQNLDHQNYWNQKNMDNSNYWNRQELDAQQLGSARSWAMEQLSQGIMPDDATLSAAGITKAEAQRQVEAVRRQMDLEQQRLQKQLTGTGGSGGTYSSGGGDTGLPGAEVYEQMYNAGLTSEGEAYVWLLSNGYNATQARQIAGYFAGYLSELTAPGMPEAPAAGGVDTAELRRVLEGYMARGETQVAQEYLRQNWSRLTEAQQTEFSSLFG